MNALLLRTRSLAVAAAVLTLGLAACDAPILAPEVVPPGEAGPRLDQEHPCQPYISGPSSSSPGASANFSFNYRSNCTLQSLSWAVSYDATYVPVIGSGAALPGFTNGGTIQATAGQCNYTVTATANFGSGPYVIHKPVSLNYDCHQPLFHSSTTSTVAGTRVSWNDVNATHYAVYRTVVRHSPYHVFPEQHMATTTQLFWNDPQYRPASASTATHTVSYRIVAVRANAVDLQHTAVTTARSSTLEVCCRVN